MTVGQLKQLLTEIPDDTVVVGFDGNSERLDYKPVRFFKENRERQPRFQRHSREYARIRQWWGNEIPLKVLVCTME